MSDEIPSGNPLGDSGPSPTVEFNGVTYVLGHPTQNAKLRYCESLLDAEKGSIEAQRARGWITDSKYDAKLDALGAQSDRREHLTGGPLWLEYSAGAKFQEGLYRFVWSLFREDHPHVTVDTVREMFAQSPALVRLAIRRVIPDFFDWIAEGTKTPREKLTAAMVPVTEQMEAVLAALGG